jgi:hypothetical protein
MGRIVLSGAGSMGAVDTVRAALAVLQTASAEDAPPAKQTLLDAGRIVRQEATKGAGPAGLGGAVA